MTNFVQFRCMFGADWLTTRPEFGAGFVATLSRNLPRIQGGFLGKFRAGFWASSWQMFCGAKASSQLGLGRRWRQLWHPEFAPHSLHVLVHVHGAGGAGGLGVISLLAQP